MSTVAPSINLKGFEAFVFDLDGCVYVGKRVVPGAVSLVGRLKRLDKRILFVTNNATKTPRDSLQNCEVSESRHRETMF